MYIDTHLHLSKEDYEDIEEVINNAKRNNVSPLIISACTKKDIEEALDIVDKYGNIYLTLGFHPSEANSVTSEDILWLKEIVTHNPKVIAIGEIGLDYYWVKDNKERQKEMFKDCLKLARELNLPVVIHSRDAYQDTERILSDYNLKVTIHCFSGSLEVANEYIKRGYFLGIGGVVTFSNTNLKDVIKNISLNNILLETDSPYLAPNPYRGKKNEPKYIPLIAEEIARIKDITIEEVMNTTSTNVAKLYPTIKID